MNDTEESIEARADALVLDHEQLLHALVAHRKKHRLSQETVAERMGVSQPTVAGFERYDANPTLSTLRRYAVAVGARIHSEVRDDCIEHATAEAAAVSMHNPKSDFIPFMTSEHPGHDDGWDGDSTLESALALAGSGRSE